MVFDTSQIQPVHIAGLISVVVFLIVVLTLKILQSRGNIHRRITFSPSVVNPQTTNSNRSLGFQNKRRISGILAKANRLLTPGTNLEVTAIRKQLIQAGFFSLNAVPIFYGLRVLMGVGLALSFPFFMPLLPVDIPGNLTILLVVGFGIFGLILPGVLLDRKRSNLRVRFQNTFPDFMDLIVVCIESGQSLDGAIDRVSREVVEYCPELGANLHLMSLEMRAGRTLTEALDGLSERVDIPEVNSLKLLLKQSEELGASIASSLRVFSDEMRDKRMTRAEAKAYALPVKLTIPLGLFIFPVILIVILTPIVIRVRLAFF